MDKLEKAIKVTRKLPRPGKLADRRGGVDPVPPQAGTARRLDPRARNFDRETTPETSNGRATGAQPTHEGLKGTRVRASVEESLLEERIAQRRPEVDDHVAAMAGGDTGSSGLNESVARAKILGESAKATLAESGDRPRKARPAEGASTAPSTTPHQRLMNRPVEPIDPRWVERERLCVVGENGAANEFGMLRTRLLQRMEEQGWRSVAIVSPTEGDGKTFLALNLALAISHHTRYTALAVDLDLRDPSMHKRLGFLPDRGIEQELGADAGIGSINSDLFITFDNPRCALLPCTRTVARSATALGSDRCAQVVRELVERYADRVVIFDLPPMLDSDDVLSFLPHVDAVVLLVCEGNTTKEQLASVRNMLADKPIASVVMNKTA